MSNMKKEMCLFDKILLKKNYFYFLDALLMSKSQRQAHAINSQN